MLTQSCGVYPCYQYVCFPWESNPLSCYLRILSCPCSTLPFSVCVSTHTCLSHTLVIGNLLVVPSVFRGCFLLFSPLLNSFSSLHFAALVIYSYSISSLSFSLLLSLWAFTFQAGIDFCQSCANMTALIDNKSTPSWQLENTVHHLRKSVCDSHKYSTAYKATVPSWFCYRPLILHWEKNGYQTQKQNC